MRQGALESAEEYAARVDTRYLSEPVEWRLEGQVDRVHRRVSSRVMAHDDRLEARLSARLQGIDEDEARHPEWPAGFFDRLRRVECGLYGEERADSLRARLGVPPITPTAADLEDWPALDQVRG